MPMPLLQKTWDTFGHICVTLITVKLRHALNHPTVTLYGLPLSIQVFKRNQKVCIIAYIAPHSLYALNLLNPEISIILLSCA